MKSLVWLVVFAVGMLVPVGVKGQDMSAIVTLTLDGADTKTVTFDGDATFDIVADGNPSHVQFNSGTGAGKKTFCYFDFQRIPPKSEILSLTVNFSVAAVVEGGVPIYGYAFLIDPADSTASELWNAIIAAAFANDLGITPTTVGAKSLEVDSTTITLLNSLLQDSLLPGLGVGFMNDGGDIECTLGDEIEIVVECKSLELVNPIQLSPTVRRQIDRAFPVMSATGRPLGSILDLAFESQADNAVRLQRIRDFAADRASSRGLSIEVAPGYVHNGKGGAIGPVQDEQTVHLIEGDDTYIEYDPETDEITTNADGFTDGKIPLHYAPAETVVTPETRHDTRSWTLLYGKKITTDNLADTIGYKFSEVTAAIGSETANAIIVTLTLKDLLATTIAEDRIFEAWLSETPLVSVDLTTDPAWVTATAASGGLAAGAAGTLLETITTGKRIRGLFDEGVFNLVITHTSAKTWYLNVLLDNGRLFSSAAITFV